jgi:hypothetical protein
MRRDGQRCNADDDPNRVSWPCANPIHETWCVRRQKSLTHERLADQARRGPLSSPLAATGKFEEAPVISQRLLASCIAYIDCTRPTDQDRTVL